MQSNVFVFNTLKMVLLWVSGSRHEQPGRLPHVRDGRDPEASLRLGSQEVLKLLNRGGERKKTNL